MNKWLLYTWTVSLTGLPSLSVPCGYTKQSMSVGMQLVGKRYRQAKLLDYGYLYEQAHRGHKDVSPSPRISSVKKRTLIQKEVPHQARV